MKLTDGGIGKNGFLFAASERETVLAHPVIGSYHLENEQIRQDPLRSLRICEYLISDYFGETHKAHCDIHMTMVSITNAGLCFTFCNLAYYENESPSTPGPWRILKLDGHIFKVAKKLGKICGANQDFVVY